ncbi:MAG: superoxide dismutase [Cellulosilyticaceae bacterium]
MYKFIPLLLSFSLMASASSVPIKKQFSLMPLPYTYSALEPYIDTRTMYIHHDKHHQKYIDDLNASLKDYPELYEKTLEELVTNIQSLPKDVQENVRKFGGGSYNHNFFWTTLHPAPNAAPSGNLKAAIERDFGSFEGFKKRFTEVALQTFGSGWTWLVKTPEGKLDIISTANQDTPLEKGLIPLVALDVWEHAYYLKYQNMRNQYINNFFNLIDWNHAEALYNQ